MKSFDDILNDVTVAEELQDHANRLKKREVIKVTESVYVAIGYALANSILIDGPEGLIVIDTTESPEAAAEIREEFNRLVPNKSIEAIIFTHNHPDHVLGAQSFVDPESKKIPDIWAYHTLLEAFRVTMVGGPKKVRGSVHQFGSRLGRHLVDVGIGPLLRDNLTQSHYPLEPNKLVYTEYQNEVIAGLNVTFIHVPGETIDQMAVWLPDLRTLMAADDIYESFPNLYAIRGTPPRDVTEWISSLRQMQKLNAEHLVPSHTHPVSGSQKIKDLLTIYASAIQLVHDQTIRLANKGLHPQEIAQAVQLDPDIAHHPYLRQLYGTIEWSVKAIFEHYFGWFSGDGVELIPLTPTERSKKLIQLVGLDGLLDQAEAALSEGDLQWSLELCSHVYRVDKWNPRAIDLRLRTLQRLASIQTNPIARNFYMTAALDDNGLLNWNMNLKPLIRKIGMDTLLNLMKIRLVPERANGVNLTVGLNFTDVGEAYCARIVYSVLTVESVEEMTSSSYDVILTTTSIVWKQIVNQEQSPLWAYLKGNLNVVGSVFTLRQFMSYFDRRL